MGGVFGYARSQLDSEEIFPAQTSRPSRHNLPTRFDRRGNILPLDAGVASPIGLVEDGRWVAWKSRPLVGQPKIPIVCPRISHPPWYPMGKCAGFWGKPALDL